MPVKRVKPSEAAELVSSGWTYVDVRSIPEFEAGHPRGAVNISLLHLKPGAGMVPNPTFQAEIEKAFPKDAKLVMGCKSGGRSFRAAEMMAGWGFTSAVDMQGGYDGERDMAGRVIVPGWRDSGLPVE